MLEGIRWTPIFVVFVILICRKHGGIVIGFSPPVVPVRVGIRVNSVSVEALKGSNGASEAAVTVSRTGLSPDGKMITDPWRRDILFSVGVERILHESQSAHQHIQIIQTRSMGRVLVLDGAFQCAEADEASYHEMITHVPILRKGAKTHGGAALVIGGGDGGVARELLRHKDVTSIDLVDIDSEVIRLCKEFLPMVWRHPTKPGEPLDSDSRLRICNKNGLEFVSESQPCSYDVIVVDASDPLGPGAALYSNNFYKSLFRLLRPGGAVAVQCIAMTYHIRTQGESFWYLPISFRTVYHGLKTAFPVVKTYQCFTAIYPGGLWNLQVATLGDDPSKVDFSRAEALKGLSFYTPAVHEASFALLPMAEELLKLPPPALADASNEIESIMLMGSSS
eukprot:523773_1